MAGQGLFRSAPWLGAVPGVAGTVIGFDAGNAGGTGFLWSHTTAGTSTRLWLDGNPIIFAPAAVERLRIDNAGNVGIGTSTPGRILDIAAVPMEIVTRRADAPTDNRVWRWANTGTSLGFEAMNDALTGGINVMTLTRAGNVGIGTTTPGAKLAVSVPAQSVDGIVASGSDEHSIFLGPSRGQGGNNGIVQAGDAALIFSGGSINTGSLVIAPWADGISGLRMDTNGRVGIGTVQPDAQLSVVAPGASALAGSVRSATFLTSAGSLGATAGNELALATIGFRSGNHSSLGIRALRTVNGSDWTSTALGLGMDVDNTVRAGASVWLHANGNVGIGTVVPRAKLHVSGTVLLDNTLTVNGELCLGDARTSINGYDSGGYHWVRANSNDNQPWLAFVNYATNTNVPALNRRIELAVGLLANATTYKSGGSASWSILSDVRAKKNVELLQSALDRLVRLRGVTFEWKDAEQQGRLTGPQMGLIAQEVAEIFPEWVDPGPDGDMFLTMTGFEAVTVEAVKELKADNDTLRTHCQALEARVHALEGALRGGGNR